MSEKHTTHHPQLDADLIVRDMQSTIEALRGENARLASTLKDLVVPRCSCLRCTQIRGVLGKQSLCTCQIEMATFRYKGDLCPHCGWVIP